MDIYEALDTDWFFARTSYLFKPVLAAFLSIFLFAISLCEIPVRIPPIYSILDALSLARPQTPCLYIRIGV
jgi:hypothetical protein